MPAAGARKSTWRASSTSHARVARVVPRPPDFSSLQLRTTSSACCAPRDRIVQRRLANNRHGENFGVRGRPGELQHRKYSALHEEYTKSSRETRVTVENASPRKTHSTSFSQPQSSRPGKAPFPSHPPSFPSTPTRPHHPLEIRWLAVNARSTPASQNTRTESQRPSAPRKFCVSPTAVPDPHRLTHTSPSLSMPPLPPPLILLPRFCSPARVAALLPTPLNPTHSPPPLNHLSQPPSTTQMAGEQYSRLLPSSQQPDAAP